MIYLGGKSSVCDGIVIYPDYEDRRQFYFLPPAPQLALDRASGRRVFKLIKFAAGTSDPTAEGDYGGVMLFDADLALSDAQRATLEAHVRTTFAVPAGALRISPLLYTSGEVRCYILGEQDWDANAPPERANLFVERLAGVGKPSLYGDNRASFSARLSREGATLFDASLRADGPIGISVVYTLKFNALQPAFNFKITAKWEQIYHYIEDKFGVDLFFVRYEDTTVVEELEARQLLVIEEVVYDEAASGDVDQLRKQLQQYVMETFFTPMLTAGEPKTNKVPGMVGDIARSLLVVPTFGHQRRELTQHELRSLSFEVSRVSAVERTIYPQANLMAMLSPDEVPGYTLEVDVDDDDFYKTVSVECVPGGFDFASSKVAYVHPRIVYGSAPEQHNDATLATPTEKLRFKAPLQREHGYRYRSSYEVAFTAPRDAALDAIYGGDLTLRSAETEHTERVLPINPMELVSLTELEFQLQVGFPRDRYPQVEVELEHEDSSGYSVRRDFQLLGDVGSARFRARRRRGDTATTRYRLIYHPAVGKRIATDWNFADDPHVVIEDPQPSRFTVRVSVAEAQAELGWADVLVRYPDASGVDDQETRLAFEGDNKPQIWRVSTSNLQRRRYEYRFSMFLKDNTLIETPGWIESDAPNLVIGRKISSQRTVSVQAGGKTTFEEAELRRVEISVWPLDQQRGALPDLVLESELEQKEFTYRALDPTHVGYAYELFYVWRDGRTRTVSGTSQTGSLTLLVPIQVH